MLRVNCGFSAGAGGGGVRFGSGVRVSCVGQCFMLGLVVEVIFSLRLQSIFFA